MARIPTFKERKAADPRFNWYKSDFDYEIWIDPTLAHNVLCLVEDAKRSGGDVVIGIVGEEGSGKSKIGRQLGRLADPTLDEKRIEFSPEEAKDAHFKGLPSLSSREFVPELYRKGHYDGKPYEAILLDESAKLDRKKTMSASSVDFNGFISQSRQLQKIFFIILPNIHMLDGYLAEHRLVAVIRTEKDKNTNARYYTWYTRKHIKAMFQSDMHKRKLYPTKGAFKGTFTNLEPFDTTQYELKKAAALEAYRKKESGIDGVAGLNADDIIRVYEEGAMLECLRNKKLDQPSVYKAMRITRDRWNNLKKIVMKKYGLKPEPLIGPTRRFLDKQEFMAGLGKPGNVAPEDDDEPGEPYEEDYTE